jgi:acyl-CoA thioesterase II
VESLIADVVKLLDLEQLEVNLFRGESRDIGAPQVFGGQVLGQALAAASRTVEGRVAHSLHAYFLRRGDFNAPIIYDVDRSRDGHSFSSRRVVAIQHGEQIFNMAASFQVVEDGFDHQLPMPKVPSPEELPDQTQQMQALMERMPERLRRIASKPRPFEFRMVQSLEGVNRAPTRQVWIKAVGPVANDETLHRCLLAYVSDFYLLDTSMLPHTTSMISDDVIMASIDHAMWFHRPLRVDEWLLYALESPSASGARGFARASVYSRDGRLVASTAQEGLMRMARAAGRP